MILERFCKGLKTLWRHDSEHKGPHMLQFSRLKLMFPVVVLGVLLTSCLTDKGGESIPASSTPWADNVQEWYFLKSVSGSEIMRSDSVACGEGFELDPLRFRLRGDSLDLGFANFSATWSENDSGEWVVVESSDTIYFGGTYSRTAGAAGSLYGSWKLVDHRPWDAVSAQSPRIDTIAEIWDFLYADEELRITPSAMTFAYPTLRLWVVRAAEFSQRNDSGVSFTYVGRDSVRFVRDDEVTTIKYKPFHSIRARTTYPGRDPIFVSLADSCDFPSSVVDSSWIYRALWDIDDDLGGEEFEKVAMTGRRPRVIQGR